MINVVQYVNGWKHPSEPLKMDCSTSFVATKAYETLFSSTGIHHDDRTHRITLEIFTKVFYVLGFDFTRDRETDEEHISLPRQGNFRIEERLKNTTRTHRPHFVR